MTATRVLLVEDEPAIAEVARLYLERDGHDVVLVGDGVAALDRLAAGGVDVVLLDIGLPGPVDGIEVCRRLRAADDWTPVVFVTARDDEVDRILGLELGADDYVTKPYSPRELAARVRSLVRRQQRARDAAAAPAPRLAVGAVVLEPDTRRATVDGSPVALTTTEFDLLAHLMARPGRVYTRAELLSAVWGYPADDGSRTVDVHVAQLRSKLGGASPIRTVRGVGYGVERP
ncbi:response regulator transcription factor [Phycicoccus sp. M110.8]|uniref:response regulator transcription factor n=1 Tax=Phycicoccus sp. M110.8 TaxID=3075433 RepID=UPI0028FD97C9|nr:response regulator transcription factor [Phycicoccus sp. M110.8]MDU0312891.1 response regulator transcription factor [Phycicoccus sp. M110.8]